MQQIQNLYQEGKCIVSKLTVMNQTFFIVKTSEHQYIRKSINAVNALVKQINRGLIC